MGFVKEFRKVSDVFPEWEYLNEIGVRDMFGQPIKDWTISLVVDRENNYYLIPRGHTSFGRDGEEVHYYALCINDKVINMEVIDQQKGRASDKNIECYWNIRKVEFPKEWQFDLVNKEGLEEIIKEGFTANTYNRTVTLDTVKEIKIDITALM